VRGDGCGAEKGGRQRGQVGRGHAAGRGGGAKRRLGGKSLVEARVRASRIQKGAEGARRLQHRICDDPGEEVLEPDAAAIDELRVEPVEPRGGLR